MTTPTGLLTGLLPTASPRQTWRFTFRLLRPVWHLCVMALVLMLAVSTMSLVTPLVLGRVVDAVNDGKATSALTFPVLVLLGVLIARVPVRAMADILIARAGEPALATLRERVMDRALRMPAGRVEASGTGDLVARVTGDVAVATTAIREVIPALGSAAFTIAVSLAGLGALDWRFALAGLTAVPVQWWALRWYLRTSGPVYARERVVEGERAQQSLETISGAATIRALSLRAESLRKVERVSGEAVGCELRTVRMQTTFFARLNFAEYVGLATVLVTGYVLVSMDAVTVGEATAAALVFFGLFDPIGILLSLVDEAQEAGAGLARLVGVARVEPEPVTDRDVPGSGAFALDTVSMAYDPGRPVLDEICLSAEDRTRVALVGASGAGKSTLAKLLAGLLAPADGGIRLGGEPAHRRPEDLRPYVGLVSQEVHVFAGTIRQDLHLACPGADDSRLWEALTAVGARSWAQALPDGLDTVVGQGGRRLDAAAAQQLALARLLLADPLIAVLDEATADAGSAGARLLDAAVERVAAGRSTVIVAHRLSQAAAADHIIVLDAGRIVESGAHDELLRSGGHYARMWQASLGAGSRTGSGPAVLDVRR